MTEQLLKRLNERGNIYCCPASLRGVYVIRFTVTSSQTNEEDILKDWLEIQEVANHILQHGSMNSVKVHMNGHH